MSDHPWQALALIALGTEQRLVALDPDGGSEHPERLLAFLRAERDAADTTRECAETRMALARARAAADQWLAALRGAYSVGAVTDAPSPAHAGVLRWFDRHFARARRHQRLAVAELAARCRSLVQSARGAGAEAFLQGWLERMQRGDDARDNPRDAAREIEHLYTVLDARSPSRADVPHATPSLRALVVLRHRDAPTPEGPG